MFSHRRTHVIDVRWNFTSEEKAKKAVAYGTNSASADRSTITTTATAKTLECSANWTYPTDTTKKKRILTFTGFTPLTCISGQLIYKMHLLPPLVQFGNVIETCPIEESFKYAQHAPNLIPIYRFQFLLLLILLNGILPLSKWRELHFISSVPHIHTAHKNILSYWKVYYENVPNDRFSDTHRHEKKRIFLAESVILFV